MPEGPSRDMASSGSEQVGGKDETLAIGADFDGPAISFS